MLSLTTVYYFSIAGVGAVFNQLASLVYTALGLSANVGMLFNMAMGSLFTGVVQLGFFRIVFDVLDGRPVDITQLFSQVHKLGHYLLGLSLTAPLLLPVVLMTTYLMELISFAPEPWQKSVFVVVYIMMLMGSFIIFFPVVMLVNGEIAFSEGGTFGEAIRNCYRLARGKWLSILGVTAIAGLLNLAGLLSCCIGLFPAFMLTQLLLGGLYLALRNGAPSTPREA